MLFSYLNIRFEILNLIFLEVNVIKHLVLEFRL